MRETCKSRFTNYLLNNEELILCDNVQSNIIDEKRAELAQIRKGAPFEDCDDCFSEVNSLFNKQLGLISSIKIYSTNEEKRLKFLKYQLNSLSKMCSNLYPINKDFKFSNPWHLKPEHFLLSQN